MTDVKGFAITSDYEKPEDEEGKAFEVDQLEQMLYTFHKLHALALVFRQRIFDGFTGIKNMTLLVLQQLLTASY